MLYWLFGLWPFRGHFKTSVKQTKMIGLLPFAHVWKFYPTCKQKLQMPCTVKCAISISEPIRQFQLPTKTPEIKSKTSSGRPRDANAGDA
ncbi:hypothetical protein DPMN_063973 [Dreissena polymorpha]|uniref:Uncharacterized protein n=1 Tax=Dreissena polymorpha TaxID=45954 RepID=A0A9D4CBH8_DREPO|nr:hypothetical protein DPMN_063973 [Dreissena polymorpha]